MPSRHPTQGHSLIHISDRPAEPTFIRPVGKSQQVVPLGGERETYRLRHKFERIERFASLTTADGVLRFIRRYGPLTRAGLDPDRGEDVEHVLNHAATFRDWLHAPHPQKIKKWIGSETTFANLPASLVVDASGTLTVRIAPESLLSALWLQLAGTLAGGKTEIKYCRHCGQLFEAGIGTRRRLDAEFCSDQHRVQYNNARRSKGE